MKLKNIIPAFIAAVAMLTGCTVDNDPAYFDDLSVSSSYVGIGTDGGTTTITLKSAAAWAFDADAVPGWLTVSPTEGGAGETSVTFTAEPALNGRSAALRIVSGQLAQEVNVIQGQTVPEVATCAEVIAGPDGKTFRVKAKVTQIANTHYGNMYIADETGTVYIYGTNDKDGKKASDPIASWGLEQGDVVTVEGPKSTYNGTVELVDVTVLAIEKSLVKIVAPAAPSNLTVEGGEVELKLAYKGIGLIPAIPADAASWLRLDGMTLTAGTPTAVEPNPADTAVVRLVVAPNEGGSRKTDVEFSSTDGTNASTVSYRISQDAFVLPHGERPDDPFTVAEAIAKCQQIGTAASEELYYAKGIISSIKEVSTSYGNATFNISDDGTDDSAITVYRSLSLGNEKFAAEDEIGVGDEVVIVGKLINYKGETPEFSGSVYIYSLKKAGAAQAGTAASPFTVAEAIRFIDGGGTDEVYVEGIVSKVVYTFSANHGTGTFWISADGEFHDDAALDFEAYSVYWLGNQSWVEGNGQVAVGDKVVLCGQLTKYKTTYETSSKKAYVYAVNGKTE